jgi:predicted metal-dependent peptidase
MTSRQFIDFLEQKFKEHGVQKLVPGNNVLQRHARRLIEQQLAEKEIAKIRSRIAAEAANAKLPSTLRRRVEAELRKQPVLSWDQAVKNIVASGDVR